MSYVKSQERINEDIAIIDKRIAIIKSHPEIANYIREKIGTKYLYSIFRPKPDLALMLFKTDTDVGPSQYSLNILTLKPTVNSPIKTFIPDLITKF
jgi:hypothetical protein